MATAKVSSIVLLLMSYLFTWDGLSVDAKVKILYAKPEAAGSADCSAWENACTLLTALNKAISGDQIWALAGKHLPSALKSRPDSFQLKAGVAVYGGFNGTETALDQRDWSTNITVLSGDLKGDDEGFTNNGDNSFHVVTGATGAILDGVTISGGNADESFFPGNCGGGMYNSTSDPLLSNVIFTNNNSGGYNGGLGGGLCNSDSNPTLNNVTFTGNKASASAFGSYGGAIYNGNSSPILTHAAFYENQAVSGGAISNDGYSNPSIDDGMFVENSASYGGAIYNKHSSPIISNATFSGNSAIYGGGGISNEYESSLTLVDVTFTGNTTSADYGSGGGMYSSDSGLVLRNVTFSSNSSIYGGGMYNTSSNSVLTNATFVGNTATHYGGGLYNTWSTTDLTNATFSANISPQGGAIYNYHYCTTTIRNSILWSDSADEIYTTDSTLTISNSDIQGGYEGAGNFDADPLLSQHGDYGGFVTTIAILPGSPVLNATSNNCPTTDGRSVARSSPTCDLGAFETQGFSLSITSGNNQSAYTHLVFEDPLCVRVTANDALEPVDGGEVIYTPPATGPSAAFTNNPAVITAGTACSIARPNHLAGGPYSVVASAAGTDSVEFNLNNLAPKKIYMPMIHN